VTDEQTRPLARHQVIMQPHQASGFSPHIYLKPSTVMAKFDAESGQVYQETEVRFNKRQHSDWIGEYKTPALLKRSRSNEDGPRSLFDMTKIKVARQVRGMGAQHLADVPWEVAEKIWEEIVNMYVEN